MVQFGKLLCLACVLRGTLFLLGKLVCTACGHGHGPALQIVVFGMWSRGQDGPAWPIVLSVIFYGPAL